MQPVTKKGEPGQPTFLGASCPTVLQNAERITRFVTGKTFDAYSTKRRDTGPRIGRGWRVMSLEKQSRAGKIGIAKSILSLAYRAAFPNYYSYDYRFHGPI